jgi:hypothetical protein
MMRVGTLTDLQGQPVGKIIEADDGSITGEGVGDRLVQQAPGKTFDDWMNHLHHSTYLRLVEGENS